MNRQIVNNLMAKYDYELDNDGQIVFYSGWYLNNDDILKQEGGE